MAYHNTDCMQARGALEAMTALYLNYARVPDDRDLGAQAYWDALTRDLARAVTNLGDHPLARALGAALYGYLAGVAEGGADDETRLGWMGEGRAPALWVKGGDAA